MTESPPMSDGASAPPAVLTRLRGARARFAAAGLLLIAVWEIGVLSAARRSEPTREQWLAASTAMPPTLRPDQLIVFAPEWIDPIGRQWFGSRMTLDQVARMDAVRFREIWEVSVRGASAPELAAVRPAAEARFGPIRVRRFVRDAPVVTWSPTDGARVCEVDFRPRRGQEFDLSHALAQGRREFRGVELGTELQLYAGLADYKRRSRNGARALVQAMVDGREVSRGLVGNDDGWTALPLAATERGAHDVEFVARVQDVSGPVDLSVCIAAEARIRLP